MKKIKRLAVVDLAEKFNMKTKFEYFIFKPKEYFHIRQYEPHRSEMYGIGLMVAGQGELKVGLETYAVSSPGLITLAPDEIRYWKTSNKNIQTIIVFFTGDFIVSGLSDAFFMKKFPFFETGGQHFTSINKAELLLLRTLFSQIQKKNDADIQNQSESIQALLRALLFEVKGIHKTKNINDTIKYSRGYYLTGKFKELLARDFIEHREGDYYAKKLFVTPKYLSETLKYQTGKTLRELINEIVCLEAKVRLQIEGINIAEVSEGLKFANPSFFGKFFKHHIGISPLHYRRQMLNTPGI